MRCQSGDAARPSLRLWSVSRRALVGVALTGVFAFGVCAALPAQESVPEITRVEEDWELVVAVPEPDDEAPQVTMVVSPYEHLDGVHCIFELNHATQPNYSAGGMQIQVWNGESLVGYRRWREGDLFRNQNETVTWTTSMSIQGQWLRFEILDGQSVTFGEFGNEQVLRSSVSTTLNHLLTYSPATSVSNSKVGYASNRVSRLVLKRVRYYVGETLVATDNTERVAFEPNDSVEE